MMPNTHVSANGTRLPAPHRNDTRLRAKLEAAVEKLITALDALDAGSEDREEDDPGGASVGEDDEPELGASEGVVAVAVPHRQTFSQERTWANAGALTHDDNDDEGEPSLGWLGSYHGGLQLAFNGMGTDDREDEHDGAEPDVDDEASLGSFDRMVDQRKSWRLRDGAAWLYTDAEDEHDGAEPDQDGEPSLGWTLQGSLCFADGGSDMELDQ